MIVLKIIALVLLGILLILNSISVLGTGLALAQLGADSDALPSFLGSLVPFLVSLALITRIVRSFRSRQQRVG